MNKRIRRETKRGWKLPANTVYVGRPTEWGNDFKVGLDGTAQEVLKKYRIYFIKPTIEVYGLAYFEPLRGKDLACYCPLDQPCHADILLTLVKTTGTITK